jgi:hypothetical protein
MAEGLLRIKIKVEFFFLSFVLIYLKAFLILLLTFINAFLIFFLTFSFKL